MSRNASAWDATRADHPHGPSRTGEVQSVRRALELLTSFTPERIEIGVNELARENGLHPSSVSRSMATLAAAGLVRVDPETGRYQLGLRILELAGVLLVGMDVRVIAQAHMHALSREVEETVNLSVLSGHEAVIVEQALMRSGIAFVSWIGRRVALHASSHGKVLLAFQPPNVRDELVASLVDSSGKLPKLTPRTIETPRELAVQLERIKSQGFATARGELSVDSSALSAPIFDSAGHVAAALVVVGPTFRMPARRLAELAPRVVEVSREISIGLGWTPRERLRTPDGSSTTLARTIGLSLHRTSKRRAVVRK